MVREYAGNLDEAVSRGLFGYKADATSFTFTTLKADGEPERVLIFAARPGIAATELMEWFARAIVEWVASEDVPWDQSLGDYHRRGDTGPH